MEHHLHPIAGVIEQTNATNLAQDRVVVVICHVVCRYWRKLIALQGKDASLQKYFVFVRKEIRGRWQCPVFTMPLFSSKLWILDDDVPVGTHSMIEQTLSNLILNFGDSIT